MKQTTRTITVQAYQDKKTGEPVCGNCEFRQLSGSCRHQKPLSFSVPDKSCPVYGEGSKEVQDLDESRMNNPAAWADRDCPKCENGGMVAVDKFGYFCVVSGCGWKEDLKEKSYLGRV